MGAAQNCVVTFLDQRRVPLGFTAQSLPSSVVRYIVPSLPMRGMQFEVALRERFHNGVPPGPKARRSLPVGTYTVPSVPTTGDEYMPSPTGTLQRKPPLLEEVLKML